MEARPSVSTMELDGVVVENVEESEHLGGTVTLGTVTAARMFKDKYRKHREQWRDSAQWK